jgi:hypothetical protein
LGVILLGRADRIVTDDYGFIIVYMDASQQEIHDEFPARDQCISEGANQARDSRVRELAS